MERGESLHKIKIKESKALIKELFAVTNAINNNRKASELYQLFQKIIQEDLGISKFAFYRMVDQSWVRVFSNALSTEEKNIDVEKDLGHFHDLKALTHEEETRLKDFDFLIPVFHKEKALAFVLLKESSDENKFSPIIRNLNYIQTLANVIVVAVENKRLFKEQVKKEQEQKEMDMAARIQRSLLPSPLPSNGHFESAAVMQPHHDIGGDYYDVVKSPDGDHIFLIADISGKGTSAALIMSNLQAFFRSTCRYESNLLSIFNTLNENLNQLEIEDKFITLFMAKYVQKEGKLRFINAGHPEQFIVGSDEIRSLKSCRSPLGIRLDQIEQAEEVTINKDDILFCYTDGLIDVYNENKEWLSEAGLSRILKEIDTNQDLTEIQKNALEESLRFSGRIDRDDDVALLGIRFL